MGLSRPERESEGEWGGEVYASLRRGNLSGGACIPRRGDLGGGACMSMLRQEWRQGKEEDGGMERVGVKTRKVNEA